MSATDQRIAALDAQHAAWLQRRQTSAHGYSCDFSDDYGNRWQIDYVMRGEPPYAVLVAARLGSSTVAIHDLSMSMRQVMEDAAFEQWESRA